MRSTTCGRVAAGLITVFVACAVVLGAPGVKAYATPDLNRILRPSPQPSTEPSPQPSPGPPSGQSDRPTAAPEPTGPFDRVAPPAALVTPEVVSATVMGPSGAPVPLVVPDDALPWAFHMDDALATRFGEEAVVAAVGQWDTTPGSRWSTTYAGRADGGAAADGRSTVFLARDCPATTGGMAHWQVAGAAMDARYGTAAVYITEIDIAVCPGITTPQQLRGLLAHEIGHALGLAHFCDQGQPCWKPGMGATSNECRVMYAEATACPREVHGDELMQVRHLYPRLLRLSGPTRVETAARASFAAFAAGRAPTVVLARADQGGHGPLAAGCDRVLSGWGLVPLRDDGPTPARLGVSVADRLARTGQLGDAAVLVSQVPDATGHLPDGVPGGAAAGRLRGPVLYTSREALSADTAEFLRANAGIRRVYVMGGVTALSTRVEDDVRALGREVIRVGGPSRVETAALLAARPEIFGGASQVVIAAAGTWADAVTGAVVGARAGAPVLLSPPRVSPTVERWLRERRPAGGFVMGGAAVLPYPVQWTYTALVGPT